MKIDNKNKIIVLVFLFLVVAVTLIVRASLATGDVLTSSSYTIKNQVIYATPTASNFLCDELFRNLESTDKMEVYNTNNVKIEKSEAVKTGYKLKTSNTTFNIIVLGDVTGDGNINLSDVSKLYNTYKKKASLDGDYLKAGLLTNSSNVILSDVAKLYNYYKGNSPFTYYSDKDITNVKDYINQAINYKNTHPGSDKIGANLVSDLNISNRDESDQIVVTSDGKVEANFLRNNFCYKKNANSEDIEIVEGKLCRANVTNFPSNSGNLHIVGSKIYDKNNHEVFLHGATIPTVNSLTNENPSKDGITNLNSLHTLRNWGANIVRLFAAADNHYSPAFIGNEDAFVNQFKKIIDMAIQNDLYVIVNWDGARNNGASFTNEAVDFFTRIASSYPNDPHIIYEIWNEPEDTWVNTWEDVHNHANTVIPAIRNISPNALVLVGTPGWDYHALNTHGHEVQFDNIMYVFHMYMNACRGNVIEKLISEIEAGVPIIVTEWGPMSIERNTRLVYDELAEASAKAFYKHKISNLLFTFGTSNDYDDPYGNKYGIVLNGKWEDDLPNRILKINGVFMKSALSNNYGDFKTNLLRDNNNSTGRDYRSSEWKDKIVSIEFKTTLDVPSSAVTTWDLSLVQDGSIMGYLLPTNTNDRYKLIISANGPINAPSNSDYLFAGLTNLENINFNGFTTKYVDKLNHMFEGDVRIVSLDLSGFDSNLFHEFWGMFGNCKSLKNLNMDNWVVNKVNSIGDMFYECNSLENIDLSHWTLGNAQSFNGLFYHCTSLKTVNISSWAPSSITTVANMFRGCSSLEHVDMRNMIGNESTDLTDALKGVKNGCTFVVNNQAIALGLSSTTDSTINFQYN